jgi:membrane-associated protease RseP (regulator of RpoE activity)
MGSSFRSTLVWLSRLRWSLLLLAGLVVAAVAHEVETVLIVVGIIVIVMVHELGHFLTAKFFDMKVTEYFLGFGPKLWSFVRGETEYGVKGIPAGGYVRIIGMSSAEEVDAADEARTYRRKPVYQRVIVTSAGSFMHFVMAFLLAFSIFVFVGQPAASTKVASTTDASISPAQLAGVKPGDRIIAINGVQTPTWDALTTELAKLTVGGATTVDVNRKGHDMSLTVTPVDRRSVKTSDGQGLPGTDPTKAVAFIGVSPAAVYKTMAPWTAAPKTASMMWHDSGQVIKTIGKVFSPAGFHTYYQNVTGTLPKAKEASAQQTRLLSPVGIVSYAHDAARDGWSSTLLLLYGINLFVGIFNMTPLLPFDGGHVAIALYEKVRSIRRKSYYMADINKMLPVSYAVLAVLLVISLSSLWLDITNPAPNPFQ